LDLPRVYYIVCGKRAITADTALGRARYFGASAEFWLNVRTHYALDGGCGRPA
jgi:antitoxin HigA-1